MFNRFSGISHREYALRAEQNGKAAGFPTPAHPTASAPAATAWSKPQGRKSSTLGTTFTQPLCLCKLQRDADAKKAK